MGPSQLPSEVSSNPQAESPRRIAVMGATGSIGDNALQVIAASQGRLTAVALSAHSRLERLVELAKKFTPKWVIATDEVAAKAYKWRGLPKETELLVGAEALEQVARDAEVDTVLAAIVGSAGLGSTLAAVEAGKTVALANKETLVAAGPIVKKLADKHGATLLPVDSEHSAIFQSLKSGTRSEVHRIVITASGGPFRTWNADALRQVTVDEALAHPTWDMGPKITIDSATLMNKALEIVEARWLFDLPADRIEVMIHPQCIVHSMVEFVDGSVIAQMSPPDMRLPIQYALEYPHRREAVAPRIDWTQRMHLEFEPADIGRYPAIELGFRAARKGGTAGVVVNAANETAVAQFLEGELHFTEIVPACKSVLESHNFNPTPTLDELAKLDQWARREVENWVCA
ncbi:1-deoxy-D-xylulose-5-phosphate reductoisomerase [Aeoliella mucimassa]|uniref:1-deoxy-D-xylulose 5-phosphate reductoisomerase n=1 Tax=Aeoliella mucimassa TaxID=2527972 RepID=A0A518AHC0_9BACT|nr:1-deoxy-D-xylulose-5-phosphate reductoisomerase [Aeoliella mucimassa]QDU54123.1 1-deoxy-D-xylulose 5-phosphate reductoisomerase [Aeoliella mucimassa]